MSPEKHSMTVRRPPETLTHPDLVDTGILSRIADRLRERLGATRVIVYGSVARGLFVVTPSDDKTFRRLSDARAAIRDLSRRIPISPLVLTPDEVALREMQGDAFIREILDTGVEL
jgi:predicted nucleotidyltransferase